MNSINNAALTERQLWTLLHAVTAELRERTNRRIGAEHSDERKPAVNNLTIAVRVHGDLATARVWRDNKLVADTSIDPADAEALACEYASLDQAGTSTEEAPAQ